MILLVEDDEDVREMLKLTLEVQGYEVDVAKNGVEALEAIERRRPCLVILDLVMPVMDGWAVLAEMKARHVSDVPVCVISALGGEAPPEAVATLCKPFESQDLLAVTQRYCSHHHSSPLSSESGSAGSE